MNFFIKPTFRTNLIIWLITAVITSTSFSFLIYYNLSNNSLNNIVKNNLSYISENKAKFFDLWLKENLNLITALAKSDSIVSGDFQKIKSSIKNYSKIYNNFSEIAFISPNGNVMYSSINNTSTTNVANSNFFIAAKNKTPNISYNKNTNTSELKIIMCSPVIKNNSFNGAIIGTIDFSKISNIFKPKSNENVSEFFIVNRNADIITTSLQEIKDVSQLSVLNSEIYHKYVNEAIKNQHVIASYTNFKGKKVLGSFTAFNNNNWILVSEIEPSQYISATKRNSIEAGVLTLLFITLTLIPFILYISRKLIIPLKSIAKMASELSVGNFDNRIYYSSNNEIGVLAQSFNSMADRLQNIYIELNKKIEDLNAQKEEINLKNLKLEQVIEVNKTILKQLEEKNKQLEQANKVKADFLSTMSHELRTPLNSIIGYTEMLLDCGDELNEEQKRDLNIILKSAEKLLGLINDVLDLSKIEAGKMTYKFKRFNLIYEIQNLINDIRIMAQNKGLDLFFEYDPDIPEIYSDPVKINHILSNLLTNAVKFTDTGYIKITLKLENEDYVSISVTDTGIGISKQDLKIIFEEFSQVDSSSTRKYGGTGLGLAIAKAFTDALGGKISVTSELGVGSTFTIKIPISRPSKILDEKQDEETDKKVEIKDIQIDLKESDKKVIVIITRNSNNYKVIDSILSQYNFKVIHTDYVNALNTVKKINPSCILIDIDVPCTNCNDGWLILLDLNQDKSTINIPKVVITTLKDSTLGLALGATDYLVKPFKERDVLSCISKCLTRQSRGYVLLVEENPSNINIISRVIRKNTPYSTLIVASLKDVSKVLESTNVPKLIILNASLSKIKPFDIINTVNSLNLAKQIPIISIINENINSLELEFLKQYTRSILLSSDLRYSKVVSEIKKIMLELKKYDIISRH